MKGEFNHANSMVISKMRIVDLMMGPILRGQKHLGLRLRQHCKCGKLGQYGQGWISIKWHVSFCYTLVLLLLWIGLILYARCMHGDFALMLMELTKKSGETEKHIQCNTTFSRDQVCRQGLIVAVCHQSLAFVANHTVAIVQALCWRLLQVGMPCVLYFSASVHDYLAWPINASRGWNPTQVLRDTNNNLCD